MCSKVLETYVPRHLRLGLCACAPHVEYMQDVIEYVPIVDSKGSVVQSMPKIKSVSADEIMDKYRCSAFRLSALVKAGVPLKVVNVNTTDSVTIDKLEAVCKSLDSADAYVEKVLAQRKERESWFTAPSDDDTNDLKEVY